MFINYIKMIIRNIWGNKGYALITTLGLAIGITGFILISFYVNYELSYDTYNKNYDNIYRVITKFEGHTHAGIDKLAVVRTATGPAMVNEMPEVISYFRIRRLTDKFIIVGNTKYSEPILYYSDPQIFDILSLKAKYGDLHNALEDPSSVVISEKAAKKYFGDINPVGNTISLGGEDDFYVTAVMEDMPINSHFRTDVLLPMIYYAKKFDVDLSSWFESSCWTYILTNGTASIEEMNRKLAEIAPKELLEGHHGHKRLFLVQKLGDIHINSHADYELDANNDINTIYLFALIGFLILVIGGLNYVNLTTARSIKRAKEVGIRKTFGAGKSNIIKQFLFESISLALLSLFIAVMIIMLVLPNFNSYVEREFTLLQFLTPTFLVYTFAAILIIGFLAGSFPAFIISSFKPASIFCNKFEQGNKGFTTRNVFILLQFSIAIILIICTVVIENQLNLISSMNMGYSRDQIINIEVKSDKVWDKLDVIKNELKNNPNVLMVSSSTYLPNEILDQTHLNWPGREEDIEIGTYTSNADYDWVDLFGIEITEGRNFSRDHSSDASGAFLLNETAARSLNWDDVIGRELIHWTDKQGKIVGIMKDFNFHSIHREIEPLYVFYEPTERHYYLSVKISGNNIPRTIEFLEAKMTEFVTDYPFEYSFFDEIFNKQYNDEIKMQELFGTFSFIAVLLSGLGLLGLAFYSTERRIKEIGIRKVMGASVPEIFILITKGFTKWVILANVIAWPLAYYFMQNWLQNYAYKIDLTIWPFMFAGISALVIAVGTVSYQSIKAAMTNPVDSLRNE